LRSASAPPAARRSQAPAAGAEAPGGFERTTSSKTQPSPNSSWTLAAWSRCCRSVGSVCGVWHCL